MNFDKDLLVLGLWLPVGIVQLEVLILSGERGGGQVENVSRDPLVFGNFSQEVRYQGRVWG